MLRRAGRGLAAAALAGALAAPGCAPPTVIPDSAGRVPEDPLASTASAPSDAVLLIGLDPSGGLQQQGSAPVDLATLSLDGGRVRMHGAAPDGAAALRLPRFSRDPAPYPRAVVTATPRGTSDPLEPGTRAFAWGASFRLDHVQGTNAVDNGDNLLQRGLADAPAFFKAELDQRRPGCTVTGSEDTLIVHASERVLPGRWYHLRCELRPGELAVYVTELDGEEPRSFSSHVGGFVGDVRFPERSTPLTLGGKVGLDGRIVRSATDQFNGRVAAAYVAYP